MRRRLAAILCGLSCLLSAVAGAEETDRTGALKKDLIDMRSRVTNAASFHLLRQGEGFRLVATQPATRETAKLAEDANRLVDEWVRVTANGSPEEVRKETVERLLDGVSKGQSQEVRVAAPAELIAALLQPLWEKMLLQSGYVVESAQMVDDNLEILTARQGSMDLTRLRVMKMDQAEGLAELAAQHVEAAVLGRDPTEAERALFLRGGQLGDLQNPSFVREFAHDAAIVLGRADARHQYAIEELRRERPSTRPSRSFASTRPTVLDELMQNQGLSLPKLRWGDATPAPSFKLATAAYSDWSLRPHPAGVQLMDVGRFPNQHSIESGEYPLTCTFSLITTSQRPEIIKMFRDFVVSSAGQEVVRAQGFVNVMPDDAPELLEAGVKESSELVAEKRLPENYLRTIATGPDGSSQRANRAFSNFVIHFGSDAHDVNLRDLNPGVWLKLLRLTEILSKPDNRRLKAVLIGHTDGSGDPDQNKRLAQNKKLAFERAKSVEKILGALGIPVESLTEDRNSMGQEMLLIPDETDPKGTAKALNRRVEIWLR